MRDVKLRILMMDDEINSKNDNPATQALEKLKEDGHEVETTETMSKVLTSLKEKYFDVYVLDIDMSFVTDERITDATGSDIGKILKERDSMSKIVVFSARGGVQDWFTAANYHFDGYIYKGDNGVEKLSKQIEKISQEKSSVSLEFSRPKQENRVLLYYHESTPKEKIEIKTIKDLIEKYMPSAEIEECNNLKEMKKLAEKESGLGLMFHSMFKDHSETIQTLEEIMKLQPEPHMIVGINGDPSDRNAILNLVNLKPFRLIDLNQPNIPEKIENGIKDAVLWYGKDEIFEYPKEYFDLYGYPLSEEEFEAIQGTDELEGLEDELLEDEWE